MADRIDSVSRKKSPLSWPASASRVSSSSMTLPSSTPSTASLSAGKSRKRKIRKKYYLETRGDVLLRTTEVFRYWKRLGLEYMFLGLEAIDEEGLQLYRNALPSVRISRPWNLLVPSASAWPSTSLPIRSGTKDVFR